MLTVIPNLVKALNEVATKPGVMSLQGRAMERKCAAAISSYFVKLKGDVLASNIRNLAVHGTKETARHAAEAAVQNILRRNRAVLQSILETHIAEAMEKAAAQMTAAESSFKEDDPIGLTAQQAADYAAKHAGEQVSGIDSVTQQIIADAVEQAIEDQIGVPQLGRELEELLDGFSRDRADMIARTEMADAFGEAAMLKLEGMGVAYKRIVNSPEACDDCVGAADEGPIPIDDEFEVGDETFDRPPFHPNCRCAVVGARPPEEDQ